MAQRLDPSKPYVHVAPPTDHGNGTASVKCKVRTPEQLPDHGVIRYIEWLRQNKVGPALGEAGYKQCDLEHCTYDLEPRMIGDVPDPRGFDVTFILRVSRDVPEVTTH